MKTIVMWPANIDAQKTRDQGRKVPLGLAIPTPTLEEMLSACRNMGLDPKREERHFPKGEGRGERMTGCIVAVKKYPKLKTLKMMCDNIRKTRQ